MQAAVKCVRRLRHQRTKSASLATAVCPVRVRRASRRQKCPADSFSTPFFTQQCFWTQTKPRLFLCFSRSSLSVDLLPRQRRDWCEYLSFLFPDCSEKPGQKSRQPQRVVFSICRRRNIFICRLCLSRRREKIVSRFIGTRSQGCVHRGQGSSPAAWRWNYVFPVDLTYRRSAASLEQRWAARRVEEKLFTTLGLSLYLSVQRRVIIWASERLWLRPQPRLFPKCTHVHVCLVSSVPKRWLTAAWHFDWYFRQIALHRFFSLLYILYDAALKVNSRSAAKVVLRNSAITRSQRELVANKEES